MGPARSSNLIGSATSIVVGGWVGGGLLTVRGMCPVVVDQPSNAMYRLE